MKFSIITVCLNSEPTIERTIRSVLEQRHADIEYIIIDGASSDGTIAIINRHKKNVAHFISEKDSGIYNAMNKGIDLASGDFISFLNADDFLIDSGVINAVQKGIEQNPENADIYFGNLIIYNHDTGRGHCWKPGKLNKLFLYRGNLPHPAMFYNKKIFASVGMFDESFKVSADYEWVVRAYLKYDVIFSHLDVLPVIFTSGGRSTDKSWNTIISSENKRIRKMYFSSNMQKIYFPLRNRIKKITGL